MELFDPTFLHSQLFWLAVSFVILLVLMSKLVVPAVTKALDDRAGQISGDLDHAAKARGKADAVLADYERKLAQAKLEAQSIVADAKAAASQVADAEKNKLAEEITRLKANAEESIAQAKQTALADLKSDVATLVVSVSEQLIGEKVDAKKAEKLSDTGLKQLNS